MLRRSIVLLALAAGFCGCGTLPNGREWGQDAIAPLPTFDRIARSALHAATDPLTWAPAAGAALLQIDHGDRKVSSWAIGHTPIFGSNDQAERASTWLLTAGFAEALASTVATPGGDNVSDWFQYKLRGLEVEGAGLAFAYGVAELGKRTLRRQRPDFFDSLSFPSGHAVGAFYAATVTSKNLDSIDMPAALRLGFQVGAYANAFATGWARVEAGKHFPADVLVGAAIGHFAAAFFHDAFLGLDFERRFSFELGLSRRDMGLIFQLTF
ncbi:MAG: phosphatase PAP2 family protein [Planctomycetes bacterium]|nr:phosphatase PAP2 family protein [Planctomycetota bacterium]